MIHPEASPVTLRVRGVPIGLAYGVENWFRAVEFVCDRLGRTETTPREAVWPTWDHVSAEGWPLWPLGVYTGLCKACGLPMAQSPGDWAEVRALGVEERVHYDCAKRLGSVSVWPFGSGISPFHSPAFPEPSLRDFAKGTTGNGDDAGALERLMSQMIQSVKCRACKADVSVPPDAQVMDERAKYIRTHSNAAYIYLDWDPKPVLTFGGTQIKIDGIVVHDCGFGDFL